MNPFRIGLEGKGFLQLLHRGAKIARHYGWTAKKMDRALDRFAAVLSHFECGATFPITSLALQRNPRAVEKYVRQGIEFAVHGHRHVDHTRLSHADQTAQLTQAMDAFAQIGVRPQGFRSPYLRWNEVTLASLRQHGFVYDSSQALAWDVVGEHATSTYGRALSFYGARPTSEYPSLPRLEDDLVRIPYSLPDDEALVERLALDNGKQMSAIWLAILDRSYELGELFALGLHPERIATCHEPLSAVLSKARSLRPAVWIARLDEIANWWRARDAAIVEVTNAPAGEYAVKVTGPGGTTILARGCRINGPTTRWIGRYDRVQATAFVARAPCRPIIGLSTRTPLRLASFLRQQGYIVEISENRDAYSYYCDETDFTEKDKRWLLDRIERANHPLIRLGRWPNGARSALVVTGDIDALTFWDYGLRLFGR